MIDLRSERMWLSSGSDCPSRLAFRPGRISGSLSYLHGPFLDLLLCQRNNPGLDLAKKNQSGPGSGHRKQFGPGSGQRKQSGVGYEEIKTKHLRTVIHPIITTIPNPGGVDWIRSNKIHSQLFSFDINKTISWLWSMNIKVKHWS